MLMGQPSIYDKFESCHMLTAEPSRYDMFGLIELYGKKLQSVMELEIRLIPATYILFV